MDNKKKKLFRLSNGINVIIIPLNTSITHLSVNILLGLNHEKPSELQLTHYMEHLILEMTSQKYQDNVPIKKELTKRGARVNGHVDGYETDLYIQGFYKDVEYFMDILSNTLRNFYLDENIANREKNTVIQELKQKLTYYEYIFNLKMYKYLYPKHFHIIDAEKAIRQLEKYKPENMYNFMANHIINKNMTVSVTCPVGSVNKTEKLVRKYFEFRNRQKKQRNITYPIYHKGNKCLRILYINNKPHQNDSSIIRMMGEDDIKPFSDKHLCLLYLNTILFDLNGGVFYNILRSQLGLIYYVFLYIDVDFLQSKSSTYYIETQCDFKEVPLLIKTLLHIIQTMTITDEQVASAKNNLLFLYENSKFFNLTSYHTYYLQYLTYKLPIIEKSEIRRRLQNIRPQQVREALKRFKKILLHKGMIFYYSKMNSNKNIRKMLPPAKSCEYLVL